MKVPNLDVKRKLNMALAWYGQFGLSVFVLLCCSLL